MKPATIAECYLELCLWQLVKHFDHPDNLDWLQLHGANDSLDRDSQVRIAEAAIEERARRYQCDFDRWPLYENVQRLAELVSLTEAERDLLLLALVLKKQPLLMSRFSSFISLMDNTERTAIEMLSAMLTQPEEELRLAADIAGFETSVPVSANVLQVDRDWFNNIDPNWPADGPFIVPDWFLRELDRPFEEPEIEELLSGLLADVSDDWATHKQLVELLGPTGEQLLAIFQQSIKAGFNCHTLLLHGADTLLLRRVAKLLTAAMDMRLFRLMNPMLESLDYISMPIVLRRMKAAGAAQYLLSRTSSVLLVEDAALMLPQRPSLTTANDPRTSLWQWDALCPRTMTIYLAPDISTLEPEVLANFTLVFEVPDEGISSRARAFERVMGDFGLPEAWCESVIHDRQLPVEAFHALEKIAIGLADATPEEKVACLDFAREQFARVDWGLQPNLPMQDVRI